MFFWLRCRFFFQVSSARKAFPYAQSTSSSAPACLSPTPPPDICTGTSQTAFGLQPQLLWLEEASHATSIFISTGISRSGKGLGLDGEEWRSIELFFRLGHCLTELGKSAVLLLSDLVIRTEFIAHTLKIRTVFPDNTFISKFSIWWSFTIRKCHRNKTFSYFY